MWAVAVVGVMVVVRGLPCPPAFLLSSSRFGLFSFEGHEVGDGEEGVMSCLVPRYSVGLSNA